MPLTRRLAPVLASCAALLAALAIAVVVHQKTAVETERRLLVAAEQLDQFMQRHILVLQSVKALIVSEREIVSRERLVSFLGALQDQDGDGAQGIGFAMAMPTDGPDVASARVARSYGVDRPPWPATDQPIRTPIVLLEPQDARNAAALSYDMYADPVRREAMQNAAQRRQPAMSRPVRLVQETDGAVQTGFLIYLPVYRDEGVVTGAAAAGTDLAGYVYAPYRAGRLLAALQRQPAMAGLVLRIYFEREGDDTLLYATPGGGDTPVRLTVPVADRKLVVRVGEAGERAALANPALVVLLLGLVIALASAGLAAGHLRAVAMTETLARETAARAELNELLLGEMQHRIKNSIARKLALFRLSARQTSDRAALIAAFEKRMQAMAKAQDLISAAPGGGLSIADLIRQELSHWDSDSDHVRLDGADLKLDAAQAQALGLIIHEMVTNSLKYGALATGGQLDVVWRSAAGMVTLRWDEMAAADGAGADAPGTGFGTRLIRMMAEGQLHGRAERSLAGRHVRLDLTFPLAS